MSTQKVGLVVWVMAILAWVGMGLTSSVMAQTLNEMNTSMNMQDNLNGGSVGPNPSYYMGKAQGAAANAQGYNQKQAGGMNTLGGMPPGPGGFGPNAQNALNQAGAAGAAALAAMANVPKITVITGTRVFDAVTKELLDDLVKKKVPESEKKNYFDDGTHGDQVAGDQEYTRIDGEQHEWLSRSNERVKEQLVQSLIVAEGYNPIEFFGYSLMSTDRAEASPRNRAWTMAPSPNGGLGQVLVEHPIDKALQVPKFRDKMGEKDGKVKNDWAFRFLQEYRKNKDQLTSEFYPLYIPLPPQVPTVTPPLGWRPFQDPTALIKSEQQKVQQLMSGGRGGRGGRGGGGGMSGGGMGMTGGGGPSGGGGGRR